MAAALPVLQMDPGNLLPVLVYGHSHEYIRLCQVEVPDLCFQLGVSDMDGLSLGFSSFPHHQVTLATLSGSTRGGFQLLLCQSKATNQVPFMC